MNDEVWTHLRSVEGKRMGEGQWLGAVGVPVCFAPLEIRRGGEGEGDVIGAVGLASKKELFVWSHLDSCGGGDKFV